MKRAVPSFHEGKDWEITPRIMLELSKILILANNSLQDNQIALDTCIRFTWCRLSIIAGLDA